MASLPTIAPEVITHLGAFPLTNTLVNACGTTLLFGLLALIYHRVRLNPASKFAASIELGCEIMLNFFDQVTQERELSLKLFPLVGGVFLFILVSNWIALLPGVGSVGINAIHDGHQTFIPLFRSANTDLNLTLGMALVAVSISHVFGIFTIGFFTHVGKYLQIGALYSSIKTLHPLKIFAAIIEFLVGILESFGEIAKVLSLSLRLFGNVFAGEILLTVLANLIPVIVPLPFLTLEILVGLVQATVFCMLLLVYLTMAATAPHHEPT